MAYHNLIEQSCTDKAELFCRMRDYICRRNATYDYSASGIGWTLHDSSYATDEDNPDNNDWFIITSAGESGNDEIFYQIKWSGDYFIITGWLYWDNVAHSGTRSFGTTNSFKVAAATTSAVLSIFGDLDFCIVADTGTDATYDYITMFGRIINNAAGDTVATSTSALSAGSDVTITLDSCPPEFIPGRKIYIRDHDNLDAIVVKTVSGNDITADLSNDYSASCKLQATINHISMTSATSLYFYGITNHDSPASTISLMAYYPPSLTNIDPDSLNDEYVGMSIAVHSNNNFYGTIPHVYVCGSNGLTSGDVLNVWDGTMLRHIKFYNNTYLLIKEV